MKTAHKFMIYTMDAGGVVTREHRVLTLADVADYTLRDVLMGWPETCVYWRVMGDMSRCGIAPMSTACEKAMQRESAFKDAS